MDLIVDIQGYKRTLGYNIWCVRREDMAPCKFPTYKRITELGFQIIGRSIFCGSIKLSAGWLDLFIAPKVKKEKIEEFVTAIGAETK